MTSKDETPSTTDDEAPVEGLRFVRSTDEAARAAADAGRFVVRVSGDLASRDDWFRWVRQSFSLPEYFGANWDALEECWRDLSWLPLGQPVTLVFDDLPLRDEPGALDTLLSILRELVGSSRPPGARPWEVAVAEPLRAAFLARWSAGEAEKHKEED